MAQPYVGEIRMFGGNFAPAGWANCDGALLPISENETLFQLIGTTYGGDGQSTFALPDLQSRIPIHMGQGPGLSSYQLAETGGVENVTLTVNQIPQHSHAPVGQTAVGGPSTPSGSLWAASSQTVYTTNAPTVNARASALQPAGGSQPHENMAPFLVVRFIISLFGIFPSPT